MAESIHMQLLERTRDEIQDLPLGNLPRDQVYIRKVIVDRNVTMPTATPHAVIIAPFGNEEELGGTNERDDIAYPVGVAIVAAANQDLTEDMDLYLLWRQMIYRKFRNQHVLTIGEDVWNCKVIPQLIVDPVAFLDQQLYVSGLVLRFTHREPRG